MKHAMAFGAAGAVGYAIGYFRGWVDCVNVWKLRWELWPRDGGQR